MIRGQTCTDVGAPSCYTTGRRWSLCYFASPSPSWWHQRILLAFFNFLFFSAHQGYNFGKPSVRTPASFSWAVIASWSSASSVLDHIFLSRSPSLSTLKRLTFCFSICEQHWELHTAKFHRVHQISFQQSPAVMDHHLTFLSKAKTVQL